MIKNYLNITLRNIRKNKWISLINISGLTIGITAGLIIYLYIYQELTYDNFHADSERIYRVVQSSKTVEGEDYNAAAPYPIIGSLHNDFNEFESATLVHRDNNPQITFEDNKFELDVAVFADSNFFDVFSYQIIEGNPKQSLGDPNVAFITESTAKKVFGDENPVGNRINVRNRIDVEIVGVVADPPVNAQIQFELIISYPSFNQEYFGLPLDEWEMSAEGYAYIKLNEGINAASVVFDRILKKYYNEEAQTRRQFYLQPIDQIHFDPKWNNAAVNAKSLWALGIIGVFIIMIGCVNFINLTTALSVKKSKEVGIRKTLGAARSQLIGQYMADTFLITFVSAIISIGLTERLLPIFNQYFGEQLSFNVLEDTRVLGFVLLLIIIVTIIAGLYPSLILSKFNPVNALKNNIHSQSSSSLFLRKGLIIVQFFISQVLIIATVVIANQMSYFSEKPLGFSKEAIVNIGIDKNDETTLSRFRDQLLADSRIKSVSFGLGSPMSDNTFETHYYLKSKGSENRLETQMKPADFYYDEVYGIELLHGRWFTPAEDKLAIDIFNEKAPSEQIPYILNETAVKKLGFNDPAEAVGQMITTGLGDFTAPIIGVVKDFHSNSLHDEIEPVIITKFPQFYYNAGIKISTENTSAALAHIEEVYANMYPEIIFSYEFMDDAVQAFYDEEQRTFNLFKIFSGVSIFISCLGLLGIISFIVNQKTKEIGVRKVLGANVSNLVVLFTKDFMMLVVIAFVIAAPASWYVMDIWLNDFAYRIDMKGWFYVVAIGISAIITFLTVGYQSFRAATENPVKALRNE